MRLFRESRGDRHVPTGLLIMGDLLRGPTNPTSCDHDGEYIKWRLTHIRLSPTMHMQDTVMTETLPMASEPRIFSEILKLGNYVFRSMSYSDLLGDAHQLKSDLW